MTLDGTELKDWGLYVHKIDGQYNMPARLGQYIYDWGDTYEALFGVDMAWAQRTFVVHAVFDPSRQTITTTLDAWVQNYKSAATHTLVFSDATGGVGTHTVYLSAVRNHIPYKGGKAKVQLVFIEPLPAFGGVIPANQTDTLTIDGKGLNAFNCVLSRFSVSNLGVALTSQQTVFNTAPNARALRQLTAVTATVYCKGNVLVNLSNLHKTLAQEKVLPIVYGSISFNAICASGFQVQTVGRDAAKFNLQLLRI